MQFNSRRTSDRRVLAGRNLNRLTPRERIGAAVAEALESRLLFAYGYVGPQLSDLIGAINLANNDPDIDVLYLTAGHNYEFGEANNYWYGPNALPAITTDITIEGQGATISRDPDALQTTDDALRFFYVSGGMSGPADGTLTLKNLTLSNGLAKGGDSLRGGGGMGAGGAIFNQGNLNLSGVTLTDNRAIGGSGGIVSTGSLAGGGIGQDANGMAAGGFGTAFPVGLYGGDGASGGGGGGFAANATGQIGGGLSGLGGANFSGANTGDGGRGNGTPGADFGGGGDDIGSAGGVGGGGGIAAGGGFGGGGGDNGGWGGFGGGGGDAASGPGGFGGGTGGDGNVTTIGGGGGAGLGGAIFSMYGRVNVVNSTLTGNHVTGGNGANGGSAFGGAIFNLDGTLDVAFSTIAYNEVTPGTGTPNGTSGSANGGAIYNLAYGNTYDLGAAVAASLTLNNSILAGSTNGAAAVNDLVNLAVNGVNVNSATVTSSAPNIVIAATGASTTDISAITVTTLGLAAALANNSGPTQTLALLAGSDAINAGATIAGVTTDQRGPGFIRQSGSAPDIGAFELQASSLVVTTNVDENDGTSDPNAGTGTSLREAITYANANSDVDTITFGNGHTNFSDATVDTIELGSALPELVHSVTITGPGSKLLTIDAESDGAYQPTIYSQFGATVNISGLTVTRSGFGAFANVTGTMNLSDCVATGNGNSNSLAAVSNFAGTASATNCTFSNNSGYQGGGIYNDENGSFTVINSTISGNTSTNSGGGALNFGKLWLINSTISGNTSAPGGGGVFTFGPSLTVINCTITGNQSIGRGAGMHLSAPSTVYNTIISGNVSTTGNAQPDMYAESDLIESNNLNGGDAKLGPLAENGGPTKTHALLAFSPAINAGSNALADDADGNPLQYDQRGPGFSRTLGLVVDIGAYEYSTLDSLVVTTAIDEDNSISDPNVGTGTSLREAIRFANDKPGADTITFGNGVAGIGTNFTDATPDKIELLAALPDLSTDITITGPGATLLAVQGAGPSGAVYGIFTVTAAATASISGMWITEARAGNGSIVNAGSLTLTSVLVAGNFGRGIHNSGTLNVINSTVKDGDTSDGGGIYHAAGALTVTRSTISGNVSDDQQGGGIYIAGGSANINHSTISGNSALEGAGIYVTGGTVTIANTTISENIGAQNAGPGGLGVKSGTVTLTNVTITKNQGGNVGGVKVYGPPSGLPLPSVTAYNTIISGNLINGNGSVLLADVDGTIAGSNNLIGGDAKLGPLADNGGPTKTHALLASSPAINTGDNTRATTAGLTTDQRGTGFARIVGGTVDKGAFESNVVPPPAVPIFAINDVIKDEGHSGNTAFTFTITRSGKINAAGTVKYKTAYGTANSTDLSSQSGTASFAAGQTTKQITIYVCGDKTVETDDLFYVDLSSASNGGIFADGRGIGTIRNDDVPPKPKLAINDVKIREGDTGKKAMTFTVTLDIKSSQAVTVNYKAVSGSAKSGVDFDAAAGTLTFAPGQTSKTITVYVIGDRKREGEENFNVILENAVNADIKDGSGRGVIVDP